MKNVEVKFHTGLVLRELQNAASRGLRQIGLDLADEINLNITINNQVDTGAMRASVFMDASGTQQRSRGQSIGEATWLASQPGRKSGATFKFAEKIADEEWQPQGKLEVKVALSAEYAIWQELMIKFMDPAVDLIHGRNIQIFSRELKKYLDK
jgi:hypothetical protein